jgi:DNA repair protein RecN (Recombination protein N)
VASGRTLSEVAELDAAGRVEEIARMMGGETITATSRKHAREMLEHAQAKPRVKAGE